MNSMKRFLFITSVCFLILNLNVSGQTYVATKGDILITGTANTHNWELQTNNLSCTAVASVKDGTLKNFSALELSIPVKDMKGNNFWMNREVYKALKAYPFEMIYFRGVNFKPNKAFENNSSITVEGNLSVAGVTKVITLIAEVIIDKDGRLICSGTRSIKMSDFNVVLPHNERKRMGVGDEVILTFAVTLEKQ